MTGAGYGLTRAEKVKVCAPILRYCKRGHLKTEATTFPRKAKIRGVTYIVRECRQCHSMRYKKQAATARKCVSRWEKQSVDDGSYQLSDGEGR